MTFSDSGVISRYIINCYLLEWIISNIMSIFCSKVLSKLSMKVFILSYIVTVCVFVRHLFSWYPFYFYFHSARIIFDVSSGFYLWNINRCPIVVFSPSHFPPRKTDYIAIFPPGKMTISLNIAIFPPSFWQGEKWLYSRISPRKNGYIVNFPPRLNLTST